MADSATGRAERAGGRKASGVVARLRPRTADRAMDRAAHLGLRSRKKIVGASRGFAVLSQLTAPSPKRREAGRRSAFVLFVRRKCRRAIYPAAARWATITSPSSITSLRPARPPVPHVVAVGPVVCVRPRQLIPARSDFAARFAPALHLQVLRPSAASLHRRTGPALSRAPNQHPWPRPRPRDPPATFIFTPRAWRAARVDPPPHPPSLAEAPTMAAVELYPPPPSTRNTLTAAQRAQLRRTTAKLGRVLGSTPRLVDLSLNLGFPLDGDDALGFDAEYTFGAKGASAHTFPAHGHEHASHPPPPAAASTSTARRARRDPAAPRSRAYVSVEKMFASTLGRASRSSQPDPAPSSPYSTAFTLNLDRALSGAQAQDHGRRAPSPDSESPPPGTPALSGSPSSGSASSSTSSLVTPAAPGAPRPPWAGAAAAAGASGTGIDKDRESAHKPLPPLPPLPTPTLRFAPTPSPVARRRLSEGVPRARSPERGRPGRARARTRSLSPLRAPARPFVDSDAPPRSPVASVRPRRRAEHERDAGGAAPEADAGPGGPEFVIPSEGALRRAKMERLRRRLGEFVPVELVFPGQTRGLVERGPGDGSELAAPPARGRPARTARVPGVEVQVEVVAVHEDADEDMAGAADQDEGAAADLTTAADESWELVVARALSPRSSSPSSHRAGSFSGSISGSLLVDIDADRPDTPSSTESEREFARADERARWAAERARESERERVAARTRIPFVWRKKLDVIFE